MDEKPKKRPWFQFQLSTAVVLMFVAAGLLWLNFPPSAASVQSAARHQSEFLSEVKGGNALHAMLVFKQGWPVVFRSQLYDVQRGSSDAIIVGECTDDVLPFWLRWRFYFDVLFCLGLTSLVAFVLEWRIRRQSAKAEPPKDGTT